MPEQCEDPSAARVIYSAVANQDAVSVVARRLRAAIGLGLLADGDRLPREADLATQLGVTKFALRGALSSLREEGVIVTRPGKVGGSFVSVRPDTVLLATDELRELSTTELRDLGDWRSMLSSVAASLAAQRASPDNLVQLTRLADEVVEAGSEFRARRACGRFYVELAAAAQSARMARAEFALHEELDWLLILPLADPDYRKRTSQQLAEIASSVTARRPDLARAAAERHAAFSIAALMQQRLTALASRADGQVAETTAGPYALAQEVAHIVQELLSRLEAVARHACTAFETGFARSQDALARAIVAELVGIDLPVDGLGFIVDPAVSAGGALQIVYWRRLPGGAIADHRHVLDPKREDFYDYTTRNFFTRVRAAGLPWAEGPYVDHGGVNDYTLTFAWPVRSGDTFLGVTATDMLIVDLERHLASWLVASDAAYMVLNAERRVIVSNSMTYIVGDVVPSGAELDIRPIGSFGWQVAVTVSPDA